MPYIADLAMLQEAIKAVAPTDIKHTKTINEEFIKLINSIPAINIIFSFEKKKYYLWNTSNEVKLSILEYVEELKTYVASWKENETGRSNRLDKLSKNIICLESSLKAEKKTRVIAGMFLISLLGGYVGSLLCRETNLSSLTWLSDRDSKNEVCNNLIRDLFQITLIDITKEKYSIQLYYFQFQFRQVVC